MTSSTPFGTLRVRVEGMHVYSFSLRAPSTPWTGASVSSTTVPTEHWTGRTETRGDGVGRVNRESSGDCDSGFSGGCRVSTGQRTNLKRTTVETTGNHWEHEKFTLFIVTDDNGIREEGVRLRLLTPRVVGRSFPKPGTSGVCEGQARVSEVRDPGV